MTRQLNTDLGTPSAVIHVLFAGIRFDLSLVGMEIGHPTDDYNVKRALARRLKVPLSRFDDHVVDRDADGNLTIQPDASVG